MAAACGFLRRSVCASGLEHRRKPALACTTLVRLRAHLGKSGHTLRTISKAVSILARVLSENEPPCSCATSFIACPSSPISSEPRHLVNHEVQTVGIAAQAIGTQGRDEPVKGHVRNDWTAHVCEAERCASVARRQSCTTWNRYAIGASTECALFAFTLGCVSPTRTPDSTYTCRRPHS